ncbi:EAL domain-containing protein [Leptothoe kymatousa]|uniref:EAL domain-containing protein n=1 Tax=Leptothoe kymatousa TAU-MAC 1615 TaxID=2364775 RepID=A0ABS5Y4E3_9CYAN|nr:EAL domain-containing protein [Leptothoe kymatousa]MBT9312695.1 EAL domain-containing protein [Leptothoe kymatousa TAU-MAC 1615]
MSEPLNVLVIEDSEDDTLLVIRELRRNGFSPKWKRVETAQELEPLLKSHPWDIIISDYTLPNFSAPVALAIVKNLCIDLPFIVVAGSIGEQLAVEMMKSGAHDYVMKDSLARLPEAVRRELRDAKNRAERKQAEIAVSRQLAAIEAATDGIGIVQNGVFIYINRSHLTLFGYSASEELIGKSWKTLYSPEQIKRFEQDIFPKLEQDRLWRGEAVSIRQDGTTFAEGLSLSLTKDNLLIRVCRDISALKQAQDLLLYNALHDPLTNLPNRSLLTERLDLAVNRAKRLQSYRYAVLFLDLDRFKVVNDSLGHVVGDQLLIAVSQQLQRHLRTIDLVARLGGDEFVVLLEEINNTDEVVKITERILADSQTPLHIDGYEIFTSFSIGIVLGSPKYGRAVDLIRDADIAMYRAKKQSNNSYQFFNAAMHTQAMNRLTLETDLRKAIKHQEFGLRYQPIINLQNQQIIGFETLIRWHHPQRGTIDPDDFVPIAEETGLITSIDHWVFYQACQQIARWKSQVNHSDELRISINFSVQDLRKSTLLQDLDAILSEANLAGSAITIEITESILIEDIEQTTELLSQLAAKQIRISIDDFGTGYSSLNYLHRLPVHSLKIDRSFVSQMHANNSNYEVVSTILALSKHLGLTAVAEGIETPEQLQALKKLGCEFGQGYLFAPPLTVEAVEKQLCQNNSFVV